MPGPLPIGQIRPGSDAAPLMPNLTDELSTAKERCLNQIGMAVLVWYSKSVKFDRVCRTFVQLNLGTTPSALSESDVTPVSLQSQTYSITFGRWKVRHLNQAEAWKVSCPARKSTSPRLQDRNLPVLGRGCSKLGWDNPVLAWDLNSDLKA